MVQARRDQVSPVTPLDPKQLQPQEHQHQPRQIPAFQRPQQPAEVTLGQRISSAITAVREFFSFSDSLKGTAPEAPARVQR